MRTSSDIVVNSTATAYQKKVLERREQLRAKWATWEKEPRLVLHFSHSSQPLILKGEEAKVAYEQYERDGTLTYTIDRCKRHIHTQHLHGVDFYDIGVPFLPSLTIGSV